MPYIEEKNRIPYNKMIDLLPEIKTKGDLEYIVFSVMQKFMKTRAFRYSTLHDCVYAVQHCADEFGRRFLDKRENEAREKNGDING